MALKSPPGMDRNVRHGMGHVEKKWPPLVLPNKTHRALGITARELGLVRHRFNHPLSLKPWQRRIGLPPGRIARPHIVRVGQTEVLVKTVPGREELRRISKMPLAKSGGGVPLAFQNFGQSDLIRMNARHRARTE